MRTPAANLVKSRLAGSGRLDVKPVMTQGHRDNINDARLIVDNQDTHQLRVIFHADKYRERTWEKPERYLVPGVVA